MKFFLARAADPLIPTPQDFSFQNLHLLSPFPVDILKFSVTQREGELAICQITVPHGTDPWTEEIWLWAEEKDQKYPLFRGRAHPFPLQSQDHTKTIELVALPKDSEVQIQKWVQNLKQSDHWDPLFVDPDRQDDPVEAIEALPSLFYWNPVSHCLSLSDFFKGTQSLSLEEGGILRKGLKIKRTQPSLHTLTVQVIAEWIEERQGSFNLMPLIESHFDGGKINTLTPHHLQEQWPHSHRILGRSGYWVEKGALTPWVPPSTGALTLYPTHTPPLGPQKISFPRFWFEGSLKMGWSLHQKRREKAHIHLIHQTIDSFPSLPQAASSPPVSSLPPLVLRLGNLGKEAASLESFFDTERGQQALSHALQVATCHLAPLARGLEIECEVPLSLALSLTLDHSVILPGSLIPHYTQQEIVVGKLRAYEWSVTSQEQIARLHISFSLGAGSAFAPSLSLVNACLSPQSPPLPTAHSTTQDFIRQLTVRDQASDQLQQLVTESGLLQSFSRLRNDGVGRNLPTDTEETEGPVPLRDTPEPLSCSGTRIEIHLHPLGCQETIERTLEYAPLSWTGPRHL